MRITTTLLLLASSVTLQAQGPVITWGTETDIVSMTGMGYYRPRVTINADGDPVVVWGLLATPTNYSAVGNGTSFSSPVSILPPGVEPAVADWQGTEIGGRGDTLWCAAKATPEMSSPMYAVRSVDGGYTWGDTIRVDAGNGPWSRFPVIAAVNGDAPVVEFMDFDSGFVSPHHSLSRMVGGVFQPANDASSAFAPGDVCDCCPGGVAVEGNDAVVLYRNAGSNIRTIWAGSSSDAGASFIYGAEVDPTNWMINACPSTGPDAYITGDSVRFVWMSAASMGSKVYVGSAHLPELTTGIGQRLTSATNTTQENYPRIAASGDTIGIVWQSNTSGHTNILFRWSVTGLSGLSQPITVNLNTTSQQRTPDIAFQDGTFHIVWSDNNAGLPRYRQATITSTIGINEVTATPELSAWPSPVSDVLHVNATIPFDRLILSDAAGRIVHELRGASDLDVRELAAGSYRLTACDRNGSRLVSTTVVITSER
jgi:hypothetical protein